jgi:septal ring factor EnvC (AmiA/AmiB activator)
VNLHLPVLLLLALPVLAMAGEDDSSKSELQALRARLQSLQLEYRAAQESRKEAADGLRQSELAISESLRQLRRMEGERQSAQASLRELRQSMRATEARIRGQQDSLGKALRAAYQRGQGDALKLILNGADPNQSVRDLQYLAYLSRAQLALIDSLRADLMRLDNLRRAAAEKTQKLTQIQQARRDEQKRLLADKNDRQQVLDKLSDQIRQQRREIATLKRDEQRLTELVERLARLVARPAKNNARPGKPQPGTATEASGKRPLAVNTRTPEPFRTNKPFSRLKGLLNLPVQGELMNRFGAPREDGGVSWKGLFIRAANGAAVKAIAAGQVVFSDWLRGFGNLIIVDHGEGYMSLYSNNESLYKQVGEAVQPGDAIAAVGNSGGQTEAGLYFEMRHQSRPFNPLSWVK